MQTGRPCRGARGGCSGGWGRGRTTVRVTTLGEEFLRGVEGECVVEGFPTVGETVTLERQQNQQNFVMIGVE